MSVVINNTSQCGNDPEVVEFLEDNQGEALQSDDIRKDTDTNTNKLR